VRVLFTTISQVGHFLPLVPIARALESAGHTVAFAALPMSLGRPFGQHVTNAGFTFLALPAYDKLRSDPGAQEWTRLLQTETADPRKILHLSLTRLFPEIVPRAMLPEMVATVDSWRPDLIISENFEFAGRVAAESRGIPHAALKVSEFLGYPERDALVQPMDALRASVGLPPDPDAMMQFRYLYMVDEPPGFTPDDSLPPTTVRMQRVIEDGTSLPSWVSELPRRPTVYATAGTYVSRYPGVLERLLEALSSEPINLILTVGHERNPSEFEAYPENVHIESYVPQSLLMPYCDAVVVHGGTGTVYTALDHGLPMVNVPIGADQFVNAERCAALGVGPVVDFEHRTPYAIRAALREVLDDPSYRERARKVQQSMHALPSPREIVPLLERLATERRPQLSPTLA
jgi:UDP:flavonoid glycosyltransferase YjiC (YdhE family)